MTGRMRDLYEQDFQLRDYVSQPEEGFVWLNDCFKSGSEASV